VGEFVIQTKEAQHFGEYAWNILDTSLSTHTRPTLGLSYLPAIHLRKLFTKEMERAMNLESEDDHYQTKPVTAADGRGKSYML
jgi:hypothetical protein